MKKKSAKRNLIEWVLIIAVIAFLYFTGLYTQVIGTIQQAVLATGLMQPDINIPADKQPEADYNLQLLSFDGRPADMNDFKGKTVFLNMWASWCPPCRAEMPAIQKLYSSLKNNKKIIFVMVSLDSDREKAKQFIKKSGFEFPVYFPYSFVPKMYDSGTIPSTYVITPAGKIAVKEVGMADYNTEKFRKFLTDL